MNEDIKLLLGYMQQYIDEPNGPDYDGEYPRCWEITTDECECILNYINVLQQENQSLKDRIEKAIEYIEKYTREIEGITGYYYTISDTEELLEILKESEKNGAI